MKSVTPAGHMQRDGSVCSKQCGYYRIGYREGMRGTMLSIRMSLRFGWWRRGKREREVELGSRTELAIHTHLSAM